MARGRHMGIATKAVLSMHTQSVPNQHEETTNSTVVGDPIWQASYTTLSNAGASVVAVKPNKTLLSCNVGQ